jgi:DNA-directed RNA polymerase specialized sigma24 family protein
VQETLLRAWRALDRFEPRAQHQTWLYRIATNACLDELEGRPRRPEPVDPFRINRSLRPRRRPMIQQPDMQSGKGWSWRCSGRSRSFRDVSARS